MNANYIYEVFETAAKHGTDLTIGLELLLNEKPLPEGVTKRELNEFIGLHENLLSRAYQTGHRKLFADIVAACVENKDDEIDFLARVRATGNEKLIAEMEAKYGDLG